MRVAKCKCSHKLPVAVDSDQVLLCKKSPIQGGFERPADHLKLLCLCKRGKNVVKDPGKWQLRDDRRSCEQLVWSGELEVVRMRTKFKIYFNPKMAIKYHPCSTT